MQRNRKIRKIITQTLQEIPTSKKQITKNGNVILNQNKTNNKKIFIKPNIVSQHKIKEMSITSNKEICTIEPIWLDETVYIIGGGPSLNNFNWNSLQGKKTIAINKAFYAYPKADALYFTDSRFYTWYKEDIDNFKGLTYTITPAAIKLSSNINVINRGQKLGLSKNKQTLSHGNNSGYAAINLAYLLGAKRIILLGYDMGNDGVKGHFHEGYPTHLTSNQIYSNQFIPALESLAPLLKNAGIEVYNACMNSMLNVYPKISIDKALSFR